ncbi:MAG TPA: hypothetical protein VEX17_04220 [Bacillales bacterium]|nr:hypothetical protein [Bacillales bacterium]
MEKKKKGNGEGVIKNKNYDAHNKRYYLEFDGSKSQYNMIKHYFDNLSADLIIFGLRFSYNRNRATIGGYLNPGRKSIVKKETYLMTKKQAKIRIKNWKIMIKRYREKGYSYPTISRIKKQIIIISNKKIKNSIS